PEDAAATPMTIEDDIFFLERVTTFAQLGFSALQIIAIGSEAKHLESGEVLFAAGEMADGGFVIQEGTLKLALPNANPSDPGITGIVGRQSLHCAALRVAHIASMEASSRWRNRVISPYGSA